MNTITSTIHWTDASDVLPMTGVSLLTVIKTESKTYIETDVCYWEIHGVWVDPSGDPINGEVILWAYTQSIVPGGLS